MCRKRLLLNGTDNARNFYEVHMAGFVPSMDSSLGKQEENISNNQTVKDSDFIILLDKPHQLIMKILNLVDFLVERFIYIIPVISGCMVQ